MLMSPNTQDIPYDVERKRNYATIFTENEISYRKPLINNTDNYLFMSISNME